MNANTEERKKCIRRMQVLEHILAVKAMKERFVNANKERMKLAFTG